MKHKSRFIVVLALILLLINTSFAIAEVEEEVTANIGSDEYYDSLSTAIDEAGELSVLDNNNAINISRDLFDIIRYVVLTALLISIFALFLDFQMATDSPDMKAKIKSKALWRTMGVIFCINFWMIYEEVARIAANLLR